MRRTEVEAVACAFYYTSDEARGWDREPEPLKRSFRAWAHAAITSLDGVRELQHGNLGPELEGKPSGSVGKGQPTGPRKAGPPTFVAILTGPEHTFQTANQPYRQIVGRRRLTGRSVREAFPEVEGQGFFELLDLVYETGLLFQGSRLPFKVQRSRDQPPEEILIDLAYHPVIDETGQRLGILVKGQDVTSRIRRSL